MLTCNSSHRRPSPWRIWQVQSLPSFLEPSSSPCCPEGSIPAPNLSQESPATKPLFRPTTPSAMAEALPSSESSKGRP